MSCRVIHPKARYAQHMLGHVVVIRLGDRCDLVQPGLSRNGVHIVYHCASHEPMQALARFPRGLAARYLAMLLWRQGLAGIKQLAALKRIRLRPRFQYNS
jgi:hypothetical protein